jgi:hypothetical protein
VAGNRLEAVIDQLAADGWNIIRTDTGVSVPVDIAARPVASAPKPPAEPVAPAAPAPATDNEAPLDLKLDIGLPVL